jgi:hypothetical protein
VVLYIAVPVIKENKHIICSSGDNPVAEKKVVLLSVSTTAYLSSCFYVPMVWVALPGVGGVVEVTDDYQIIIILHR